MPINVRVPAQTGQVAYFKAFRAEILGWAGPCVRRRERTSPAPSNHHQLVIDRAHPIPVNMNAHSWQMYYRQNGQVDIGDVKFVVLSTSGADFAVEKVFEMEKNMTGPGVWDHVISPAVAVQAGWLIGLWFRNGPSGGGIIPQYEIDDIDDETIGVWYRTAATEPVGGSTVYSGVTTFPDAYRTSLQLRGPGTDVGEALLWVAIDSGVNDESFKNGDGPIPTPALRALGASGAAPEYYIFGGAGGFPTQFPDIWDLSHTTTDLVVDGASGSVAVRLVNGANTVPVNKVMLGVPLTDNTDTAQIELFWSNDATDTNPDGITDWEKFFQYPEDWRTPITSRQDNVVQVQLARKVKWIRMAVTNNSGATRSIGSLLVYSYDPTAIVGTNFVPNLADANPEFFEVTREGITFLMTQDAGSGTNLLTFGQSVPADYDGLVIGQSIWLRSGTQLWRYEIAAFNAVAQTITIVGTLNEAHSAGEFVDTRILAIRLDGYDSNNDKIRESPPLIAAGQFHEKWISKDDTLP